MRDFSSQLNTEQQLLGDCSWDDHYTQISLHWSTPSEQHAPPQRLQVNMADPCTVIQTVAVGMNLTKGLIKYIQGVHGALEEKKAIMSEATLLFLLLYMIRRKMNNYGESKRPEGMKSLEEKDGPLEQYNEMVQKLYTGFGTKRGSNFVWPSKKGEKEQLIQRMERLKSHILAVVSLDTFDLSETILDKVYEIGDNLDLVRAGTIAIQDRMDEGRSNVIAQWLSEADDSKVQSDLIHSHTDGTVQWLFDLEFFNNWQAGLIGTLYCQGGPGVGKTVLAATVINHLQRKVQCDSRVVLHLYCHYKKQSEQSFTDLLQMLLRQCAKSAYGMPDPIQNLYQRCTGEGRRPSEEEMQSTLDSVMSAFTLTYIVHDAVDECEDQVRNKVIKELHAFQKRHDVRLLVTSREREDIESAVQPARTIPIKASNDDMEKYIRARLGELPGCETSDVELQEKVIDAVVTASDGIFLLPRLHTDSLKDKLTKNELLKSLQDLLSQYDAAYAAAMKRVLDRSNRYADLACEVLSWVTRALRPLKSAELQNAIAFSLSGSLPEESDLISIRMMLSVCGGLVKEDSETGTVRLVHVTLQEYLECAPSAWLPNADSMVAKACLRYLSIARPYRAVMFGYEVAEGYLDLKEDNRFRLLKYADENWARHIRDAEKRGSLSDALQSQMIEDIVPREFLNSIAVGPHYGVRENLSIPRGSMHYSLWCAVWFNLEFLVRHLVATELATYPDNKLPTALAFLAAELGLTAIIEIFLQAGYFAPNETFDGAGLSLLHRAAEHGHADMLEALLNVGASVDLPSRWDKAHRDRDEIILGSLHGPWAANVTPLIWAAKHGQLVCVELLLSEGADARQRDKSGKTILINAAYSGNVDLVEFLVGTGMLTIDDQDRNGSTALSTAAKFGNGSIVKFLLSCTETPSTGHISSIHENHHSSATEVDVNLPDKDGRTPFSHAAAKGRSDIVQLLLGAAGIDVDVKDKLGRTPFAWACYNYLGDIRKEETLKLLANTGNIDLNSKDNNGFTPLSHAINSDNLVAVRFLLGTDKVDVNELSQTLSTPFRMAVFKSITEGQYELEPNVKILALMLATGKADLTFGYQDEHGRFTKTNHPDPLALERIQAKLDEHDRFTKMLDTPVLERRAAKLAEYGIFTDPRVFESIPPKSDLGWKWRKTQEDKELLAVLRRCLERHR